MWHLTTGDWSGSMKPMRPDTRLIRLLAAGVLFASAAHAQDAGRSNLFNDPFFQVSSSLRDCPEPAGPRVTEAERMAQSHYRSERGTRCFLSGACDRPTAYAYDQDIAKAFQAALPRAGKLEHSSLWVTVQRRFIFIEGCALQKSTTARLEKLGKKTPYVEQVLVFVSTRRGERPPYKLLNDSPVPFTASPGKR